MSIKQAILDSGPDFSRMSETFFKELKIDRNPPLHLWKNERQSRYSVGAGSEEEIEGKLLVIRGFLVSVHRTVRS